VQNTHEEYDLSAVIVHSGTSSESGHYYCYARSLNDKWILFNDSRVSYSSFASFSSVTSKFSKDTAYLLFYTKHSACQEDRKDAAIPPHLVSMVEKDNRNYVQVSFSVILAKHIEQ
jgi:ubiquitin carboxyl-terminal hydrolase 35/38